MVVLGSLDNGTAASMEYHTTEHLCGSQARAARGKTYIINRVCRRLASTAKRRYADADGGVEAKDGVIPFYPEDEYLQYGSSNGHERRVLATGKFVDDTT